MHTTRISENGVRFETGLPVQFIFIRNTERAPRIDPKRFQQDIEPAGLYLLHDTVPDLRLPRRWIRGRATFISPLVLMWSPSDRYDEESWKAQLARQFRARGKALTRKLLAAGYDAVVTVRGDATSEIVSLDPARQIVVTERDRARRRSCRRAVLHAHGRRRP